jgi:hypothetical protein
MITKKLLAVVFGALAVLALSLSVMAQDTTQSTTTTTQTPDRPQTQTTQTHESTTKYKHHHKKVKKDKDTTTTTTTPPEREHSETTTTTTTPPQWFRTLYLEWDYWEISQQRLQRDLMDRLSSLKTELAFLENRVPELESTPGLGRLAGEFKKQIEAIRQEIQSLEANT